ncbi:MAG: hypothetical protein ABIA63_11130, partial [bacterium]
MRKLFISPWLILSSFLIPFVSANPKAFVIEEFLSIIEKTQNLTIRQEYDSAIIIINSVSKEYPRSPVGYYIKMITLEARMIDYENTDDEKEFLKTFNEGNSLMDSILQESGEPWYLYFKGAMLVSLAIHQLRFTEYFNGTLMMLKGIDFLEKSHGKDSTLSDALLYPALYKYAKKQIKNKFSWAAFWHRKTDNTAISLIEKCSVESYFSKEISRQVLIGLYTREKE